MRPAISAFQLPLGVTSLLLASATWAHQPVMDMAPRWEHGYGFQLRYESYGSDTLVNDASEVNNPFGLDNDVSITWLEGIYTFRREVRVSVKIPYINQRRHVIKNGLPVKQSDTGLGDIVIGVPLKRYTNEATATSNIAVTPSIRLPTGSSAADYPVGDGSTDFGVSFSASFEKAHLYQYYDLFLWKNGQGRSGIDPGDEIGFDANIGWHPYHDNERNEGIFLMTDVSLHYQERGHNREGTTGGTRLLIGPVFVYYLRGMMFRAEYKYPVYEALFDTQVARDSELNVGIGFVF